jgi:hypothetical protein
MIKENDHRVATKYEKNQQKTDRKEIDLNKQETWDSISKNYDMIQGAQLSNSFIILMALESEEPLSTTQISELISRRSKGQIYRISATLKDSLEFRLKREGYVKGAIEANKTLYSITPKGRKLLMGWIAFLSAYS